MFQGALLPHPVVENQVGGGLGTPPSEYSHRREFVGVVGSLMCSSWQMADVNTCGLRALPRGAATTVRHERTRVTCPLFVVPMGIRVGRIFQACMLGDHEIAKRNERLHVRVLPACRPSSVDRFA